MVQCARKPFAFAGKKVRRSPFKTLKRARAAEAAHKKGRSVGFTARSSLKSMGRVPRSNGCYRLGNKYATRKI
jgi:hypothetical protein